MRLADVASDIVGARLARAVRSRRDLLLGAGERLTPTMVRHLERRGVRHVYVNDAYLPDVPPDADVNDSTRELLNETLQRAMDTVSDGDSLDVGAIQGAAGLLAQELGGKPSALFSLSRLRAIDEATVQHSVNVAIFAMLAATHYELDADERTRLGMGALLHDVGKALVPVEVLRKPGPLEDAEWQEMRRHPELGYRLILERGGDVDPRVAAVALHHHERIDGKGYPAALKGGEVDLFARLTMVADVWDAMVSPRWYKPAFSFAYTARHMRQSPGLDQEAVEALLARVALFPTGSFVRLTTGALAWVVAQDTRNQEMPMVMVLTDTVGGPVPPYVAQLAGGRTRVAVVLPELPPEIQAHCRQYTAAIASALDAVDIAVPQEELVRVEASQAAPGRDGAR